jgi:hypothetical protein
MSMLIVRLYKPSKCEDSVLVGYFDLVFWNLWFLLAQFLVFTFSVLAAKPWWCCWSFGYWIGLCGCGLHDLLWSFSPIAKNMKRNIFPAVPIGTFLILWYKINQFWLINFMTHISFLLFSIASAKKSSSLSHIFCGDSLSCPYEKFKSKFEEYLRENKSNTWNFCLKFVFLKCWKLSK